ncbi:SDR family NAD(P)-dependent oxidoreductase [Lactobacillus sp. LC28-10]|uniref:SDR family NAD(P)-dependent oxidoreductase n=1 Tax=Secundilactobacillus angelensis TaxID=2722706 RepID=A0ABX1KXR0_9LACO|nr:SDR family NAD(P)-dependent oxidoreductase [Secundilactobacillus angelensis]MCH5461609.1 SDR family NAD(P)-dependent oxidoreductase [Secundilactobacillus angelensis]NLR17904.1 SDR family NAD(P)-dependent oxidoreductase [Secundilactobacillus angelensis]
MAERVILITGASSGMGYAATQLFAQHGWEVYAGARRVEKIPTGSVIHPLYLDVTDADSRLQFVKDALADGLRVDVLLNNAGYGEFGPLEEVSVEKVHKQLETNLVGASELTKLVLPQMRQQGSGRIVNNSSIGGDVYSPLGGWYYVTKRGLNVWSDVLDTEIRQFGLRSVIVAPGGTESSWLDIAMDNVSDNLKPDSPYTTLTDATRKLLGGMLNTSEATAKDLAKVFYRAATERHPKRRYYYSIADRLLSRLARNHPSIYHESMSFLVNALTKNK